MSPSIANIAAKVKTANKSSTLAVLPLVLASVAVTGYARTHTNHMQAVPEHERNQQQHDDAELLHQHVAYPSTSMLAPRKTLHSTPLRVFTRALQLLDAQSHDVLYDIGCGDGRCVIAAAKELGIRAVGIEIDAARAAEAQAAVREAQVEHLVTIRVGNAMEMDFSDATIIFLFLIERGLRLIRPRLEALPRSCRVVTYLYKFPALPFEARHVLQAKESQQDVAFPVFFYRFPTISTAAALPAASAGAESSAQ
ncbi:TPA: hypothetical protein N0F65_003774 [Lagenidium giganteum]|uniref:Methyltransferase domain-containing protein n=1 Tax=Lagenidium giganteum TaxID=4803 RepID=A0AAV2YF12_9STRA|nr:TPA: hypothetical protein N0F65_003774 [Lagenidium giganteum]